METKKIVIVDNGALMFKSIIVASQGKKEGMKIPATWYYLRMLFANLKRLELTPDDMIIIAIDSKLGSWRKDVDKQYKANRKGLREQLDINWEYVFNQHNRLMDRLEESTPFILIDVDKMEADDIMAYACKHFKENEIILITHDSDMELLFAYDNVKIFSPTTYRFKEKINPYKLLTKKITRETSDNLISPINTEADYEKRKMIVNLIDLPEKIQNKLQTVFLNVNFQKEYNIERFPFPKMKQSFLDIYNKPVKIKEKKKITQKKLFK